jgi:phosphatidate cytidylyltransferase
MAQSDPRTRTKNMKINREIAGLILAAIGIPAIYLGGIFFFIPFAAMTAIAAWEYGSLFVPLDIKPLDVLTVGGTLALLVARAYFPVFIFPILTLFILVVMAVYLVIYERGRDRAAIDFAVTMAAIIYLGWLGGYFYDLRALPEGLGWFILVMAPLWVSDSAAYYIGSRYGKHKMTPRLSPKKSWEGYIASIIGGGLAGMLIGFILNSVGWLNVALLHSLVIGLLMGAIPTLGDLGESMIKRQAGIKDSGGLIPGHGGAFDRIDSWLWAAPVGYLYIVWFIS